MPRNGCLAAFAAAGAIWIMANPVIAADLEPEQATAQALGEARKWDPWAEVGGYAANRSSARRGELALWAPLLQDPRSLFFADLRGKLYDEDQYEGNAALGYRFMGSNGWNPGFWIGFDRSHTEFGSDLHQVSFGVEALSPDWDIRLNGYVPLDERELIASGASIASTDPTVEIINGGIFLIPGSTTTTSTSLYELAFWGVDAEIGYRIPLERLWGDDLSLKGGSGSRHHDLRVFLGGFYFDHADFDGEVAGPRARAELRIDNIFEDWDSSRLTFETAWQHDEVRDHQFEGGVRLRIPLGGSSSSYGSLSPQERRMTEGLKRDTDIVAEAHTETKTQTIHNGVGGSGAPEAVEDAETGVALNQVVTVENGADLGAAVTAAGANSLIVANGGTANFGHVTMVDDQTLLGGNGSIQVRGRTSGTIATYTAPGTTPTLQYGGTGGVITGNSDNHVAGVIVDGLSTSDRGIEFFGAGTAVISDSRIQNINADGATNEMTGGTFKIRNSTISNVSWGVVVFGDNVHTIIENNRIENAASNGIFFGPGFFSGTGTTTIANNTFNGIFGGSLVTFPGGTVSVTPDSIGNVDASAPAADRCDVGGGTFTGSFSFTDGPSINQSNC